MGEETERWLSERYWPGLTAGVVDSTLAALRRACAELGGPPTIELIEGAWLPDDEVLTARFAGTRTGVVAAHELAGAAFDRLSRVIAIGSGDERSTRAGGSPCP